MSIDENPFRWVPTLQHIASVKIIQMVWRNSEAKEIARNEFQKVFYNDRRYYTPKFYDLAYAIIQHLDISIDNLMLPPVVEDELKSYVIEMGLAAESWLYFTVTDIVRKEPEKDWTEAINYFVDNLCWNDIGFVDGRTILESYVSNKDTIDFDIWHQLCFYCIEDEIVRLAGTIDWDNCRKFDLSRYPIYWYWKIYGKFPTKRMFKESYWVFERDRDNGLYDEDKIIENMFKYSAGFGNDKTSISAVKYFWNYLKNDHEFRRFVADSIPSTLNREIAAYLLRKMSNDTVIRSIQTVKNNILRVLTSWPWIFLFDNWISLLEESAVPSSHFLTFFGGLYPGFPFKREEHESRRLRGNYDKTVYQPFKKLWVLFYRRFGSDDEIVREIFWEIFGKYDISLLKIVFDGVEDSRRKFFIRLLQEDAGATENWKIQGDSVTQFVEKVLKDEGERKLFWEIIDINFGKYKAVMAAAKLIDPDWDS